MKRIITLFILVLAFTACDKQVVVEAKEEGKTEAKADEGKAAEKVEAKADATEAAGTDAKTEEKK